METLLNIQRIINHQDTVKREQRLLEAYPTQPKPEGWGSTNPLNHNPNNFRYFVHATTLGAIEAALKHKGRGRYSRVEAAQDKRTALLDEFLNLISISCTLIDEIHRGTYKPDVIPSGLILEVPPENIVAADYTDNGTWNEIQDKKERERYAFYKQGAKLLRETPSAQAFINNCRRDFRNELVVDGVGPEGRRIQISGVFLLTDPQLDIPLYDAYTHRSWHPRDLRDRIFGLSDEGYAISERKKQYKEIRDLAAHLAVPIIRIPAPFVFFTSPQES